MVGEIKMGSSRVSVALLACGSYNPPTNMHLRMFGKFFFSEFRSDYKQSSSITCDTRHERETMAVPLVILPEHASEGTTAPLVVLQRS